MISFASASAFCWNVAGLFYVIELARGLIETGRSSSRGNRASTARFPSARDSAHPLPRARARSIAVKPTMLAPPLSV